MLVSIDRLPERIEAACVAVLAAENLAAGAAAADDFLLVAESLGTLGRLDEEDLRRRGLGSLPLSGQAGVLLRGLPLALMTPLDRPGLRRSVHRCVSLANADEGAAITSVAAALLTADLLRFELGDALVRVRQSLLEEAPRALLDRLSPLPEGSPLEGDQDPSLSLQLAITGLHRGRGVRGVLGALDGPDRSLCASITVAAAMAAARDGLLDAGEDWLGGIPHRARAAAIARDLAARAQAQRTV